MKYRNKFFKTKEEAIAFQKEHGGALYSNAKYSKTKMKYMAEALGVAGLNRESINKYPFCVAWNEVE